ncbi:siderophore-interacting protein [Luethyella okanaganae]|uniref:Siderophore-interacting protein n=1 Tax=Luethyella okanaganae TaxID=69372 RepID=A0ABW1VD02_9MICO
MSKQGYRGFRVRVRTVDRLSPHFTRVTFTADDLADFGCFGADQRIKVVLPIDGRGVDAFPDHADWYQAWRGLPEGERNPIRTYTIRDARPAQREVDVDFVAHGDSGPASRWIATAAAGDELVIIGPDATSEAPAEGYEWKPGRAETLLLVGDETAAPAICSILEGLPADARGCAFIEVPTAADALAVSAPVGVDVRWLPRDAMAFDAAAAAIGGAGYGSALVPAVRGWAESWVDAVRPGPEPEPADLGVDLLWEVPEGSADGDLYAWLAGEASAITTLRRHLVCDLGIDRKRVAFMGYWKLGRAEN